MKYKTFVVDIKLAARKLYEEIEVLSEDADTDITKITVSESLQLVYEYSDDYLNGYVNKLINGSDYSRFMAKLSLLFPTLDVEKLTNYLDDSDAISTLHDILRLIPKGNAFIEWDISRTGTILHCTNLGDYRINCWNREHGIG